MCLSTPFVVNVFFKTKFLFFPPQFWRLILELKRRVGFVFCFSLNLFIYENYDVYFFKQANKKPLWHEVAFFVIFLHNSGDFRMWDTSLVYSSGIMVVWCVLIHLMLKLTKTTVSYQPRVNENLRKLALFFERRLSFYIFSYLWNISVWILLLYFYSHNLRSLPAKKLSSLPGS